MAVNDEVFVLDSFNCEFVLATVVEVNELEFVARCADEHTYICAFENEGITWSEKNG